MALSSVKPSIFFPEATITSTRAQHSFSPVARRTRNDEIRDITQGMEATTVTGNHSSKTLLRGYILCPWLLISLKHARIPSANV